MMRKLTSADKRQLTYHSLFSGQGGFDLGFDRAGLKCLSQVEIDNDCIDYALSPHWPDVPKFRDIRTVTAKQLGWANVVCFGSPCQGLSQAGKRNGLNHEKSKLFFEATRIIKHVQPDWVIWENVTYALASNAGRDFTSVLLEIRQCGAIDIAWRIIDARAFGIPTARRRLFLVADFRGERASEILHYGCDDETHKTIGLRPVFNLKSMWNRVYNPHGPGVTFRANGGGGGAKTGLYIVDTPPDRRRGHGSLGFSYRLAGNAVIPQVAEWIGKRLMVVSSLGS